ncbi:MAG: cation:proton antiporter subunit C [Polyangiaceae bacterium]|nr:cation:proton antiporter subunit C [Polyangiaceae bacterium]
MNHLPYAVAAWLLLAGLYGIVTSRNLLHLITCVWLCQTSTYVLLIAIGYREGGTAPVLADIPAGARTVDPIVQSLALTDIVVGVVVSALLFCLAVQAHKRFRTLDPDGLSRLRG